MLDVDSLVSEHNRRTFEDLESSESQFLEIFANTLFDWSCALGFTTSTSIASFIDSLYFTYATHSLYYLTLLCSFFMLKESSFSNKASSLFIYI